MGYFISKAYEELRLLGVEENIKRNWEKFYEPDLQKAFTSHKQMLWYRYLNYQKERGWILDFYPLSKVVRKVGKVGDKEYIYYPDFEVEYPFGNVLHEIIWGKTSRTFFLFLKENKFELLFIDRKMVKDVITTFSPVIDFSHRQLERKDIVSGRHYKHFR